MADILIRRVRFPENCAQCFNAHDEYCYLLNRRLVTKDWAQRKDDCPLHELPPHGDLISREQAFRMMLDRGYQKEAAGVILEVPVIVPSNKERSEYA